MVMAPVADETVPEWKSSQPKDLEYLAENLVERVGHSVEIQHGSVGSSTEQSALRYPGGSVALTSVGACVGQQLESVAGAQFARLYC